MRFIGPVHLDEGDAQHGEDSGIIRVGGMQRIEDPDRRLQAAQREQAGCQELAGLKVTRIGGQFLKQWQSRGVLLLLDVSKSEVGVETLISLRDTQCAPVNVDS